MVQTCRYSVLREHVAEQRLRAPLGGHGPPRALAQPRRDARAEAWPERKQQDAPTDHQQNHHADDQGIEQITDAHGSDCLPAHDARHHDDLLGLGIELVDPLRWLAGPHGMAVEPFARWSAKMRSASRTAAWASGSPVVTAVWSHA